MVEDRRDVRTLLQVSLVAHATLDVAANDVTIDSSTIAHLVACIDAAAETLDKDDPSPDEVAAVTRAISDARCRALAEGMSWRRLLAHREFDELAVELADAVAQARLLRHGCAARQRGCPEFVGMCLLIAVAERSLELVATSVVDRGQTVRQWRGMLEELHCLIEVVAASTTVSSDSESD